MLKSTGLPKLGQIGAFHERDRWVTTTTTTTTTTTAAAAAMMCVRNEFSNPCRLLDHACLLKGTKGTAGCKFHKPS